MSKTPYLDDFFYNANDRNLDFCIKLDISLRSNQFWENIGS